MRKTLESTVPYKEGTWFTVPLRNGGFAVGNVARMDGHGSVFGYFFGPKRLKIPPLEELTDLHPREALACYRFGDLGLLNGGWQVVGHCSNWDRLEWRLPPFVNVDERSGKALMVHYSDDDLAFVFQEPCDPALAEEYPRDLLSGYGAVEIKLTKLLDPTWTPTR